MEDNFFIFYTTVTATAMASRKRATQAPRVRLTFASDLAVGKTAALSSLPVEEDGPALAELPKKRQPFTLDDCVPEEARTRLAKISPAKRPIRPFPAANSMSGVSATLGTHTAGIDSHRKATRKETSHRRRTYLELLRGEPTKAEE